LLDGRNRLDAMEAAGLTPVTDAGRYIFEPVFEVGGNPVISANIKRRHLDAKQRQDLLITLIALTPEKS
jgi:hypothetical protein